MTVTKGRVSRSGWLFTHFQYIYMSQCHRFRATVPIVSQIDQSSLATQEINHCQNSLTLPLMMETPDTNGWGKKKVNSHQVPLLITDKGPNLGLDLCQSTSKVVTFLISSARVRPEFGSPTVVLYFILAASLTSGSWDCNQLRVIQSI